MFDPNAKKEETAPHMVTEDDLARNPDLAEAGVKAGDEIGIPVDATGEQAAAE